MEHWLLVQTGHFSYIALGVLLLGGALGFPIPEDVPLILAGVLLHQGHVDINILFAVCYFAVVVGDCIIFSAGRAIGPAILRSERIGAKIPQERVESIKTSLNRHTILMIFVARHLFYLRTVTFLICGGVRMSWTRFLIADAIAALVSIPIMVGLGYLAAQHYNTLLDAMYHTKVVALLLIIAVSLGYLAAVRKKRKLQGQELEDDEEIEIPSDEKIIDFSKKRSKRKKF